MRVRDELRQRARVTGSQDDWQTFKTARNKCVKSVKSCKEQYFQDLYRKMETEKTSKGLFGLTKELCGNKNGNTPQTLQKIPVSYRNPHRYLLKALENWEKTEEREIFEFREISLAETISIIQSMSDSTVLGHDDIDTITIKVAARYLASPLRRIINFSLKKGKFIQKWKFAKIMPILKSKDLDPTDTSAYRPVSVLTSTSKVVERAAQVQLLKYFEESMQLNASAHAYRRNFSTTTTLMEIIDEIHQGTEEKKISSIMAINQSAAFDSVDHVLLLQKLELYNVGELARKWIKEYLELRTQYVMIGTGRSLMKRVKSGVPQGSVIGPLMFALFTNELSETVKEPTCQDDSHGDRSRLFGSQCSRCGILTTYADDSTFTVTSKDRQTNWIKLRRNLDEIECFLTDNRLCINVKKMALTECMIQQKKGKTPGIPPYLQVTDLEGRQKLVEDKIYTRILGANIQSNLGWLMHLEGGAKAVLPAARKQLGLLKHQGSLIPISSRLNLARSLILSKLTYMMPVWGGAKASHIRKAQVVMNAAARWATGLPRRTRVSTLMRRAGWLSVHEQIKMTTLTQTWKTIHLGIPLRVRQRMEVLDDLSIIVQEPRLLFSHDCLRWRSALEWNSLDESVRKVATVSAFKRQIKRLIIQQRPREPD